MLLKTYFNILLFYALTWEIKKNLFYVIFRFCFFSLDWIVTLQILLVFETVCRIPGLPPFFLCHLLFNLWNKVYSEKIICKTCLDLVTIKYLCNHVFSVVSFLSRFVWRFVWYSCICRYDYIFALVKFIKPVLMIINLPKQSCWKMIFDRPFKADFDRFLTYTETSHAVVVFFFFFFFLFNCH